MREVEIVGLRKEREKHFLQENGEMIAKIYSIPIHFKKGNKYEEIDNTLVKENNYYKNKNNDYIVQFVENTNNLLMKMIKDNYFLEIKLDNQNSINGKFLDKKVIYNEILPNIDLEYLVLPTKVKENIILKNSNFNKISFLIKTNLELIINNEKIEAKKNDKCIFNFEPLFMIDNNKSINHNIHYSLIQNELGYKLDLNIDEEWLKNASYPVVIDPIITNTTQEGKVYDTYISNNTDNNKNQYEYIKAGVQKYNEEYLTHRSLIKFDLPTIGTGSQVIKAYLNLVSYPVATADVVWTIVDIHRVTQDWSEDTAKWSIMHDKYDTKLETYINTRRSMDEEIEIDGEIQTLTHFRTLSADITDLVKKWYTDTPNYGIMLKSHEEVYVNNQYPIFYSNVQPALEPSLVIHYRNQNGLENYMNYVSQKYTSVNTYNGNLVGQFLVGQTIGGNNTIGLSLIYNTNDVILENDYKLGKGFKFNYHQTIESADTEETVAEVKYLKYTDADGTIHYFYEETSENDELTGIFVDEDGLNLTITKEDNIYTMVDKYGNKLLFNIINNIGYLSAITNTKNEVVQVIYDENNRITKIVDSNNSEINIEYDAVSIIITSIDESVTLSYQDNKIISINNLLGRIQFAYNEKSLIEYITDINGLKIKYEYYDKIPYRVKRVSEYSINNNVGNYFDIEYSYNSTTIKDNKNRVKIMTFNNSGNLISSSTITDRDNLREAYSNIYGYEEVELLTNANRNKLHYIGIPVKYVNNLLPNSSFEDNLFNFISEGDVLLLTTEYANTGLRSIKATSSFYQEIELNKDKYYTFSAYIKNNNNITLSLSYDNQIVEKIIEPSDDFSRRDITIFYPSDAISNLKIRFILTDNTTIYIDDIQLEEGNVVNSYNMISNSDFSLGLDGWITSTIEKDDVVTNSNCFEVISLDSNNKALKISMDPNRETTLSKTFPINGKEGDYYEVSFWYKYEGINCEELIDSYMENKVNINFGYTEEVEFWPVPPPIFNPNRESWQYYRYNFFAVKDYENITLAFEQKNNINDFYITNISLIKDPRQTNFGYDEEGNKNYVINESNYLTSFEYDSNNQLIKITNPYGRGFKYEYDNKNSEQVINGISESGINSTMRYDCFGNQTKSRIMHKTTIDEINGLYKIRGKGTNDYIRNINKAIVFDDEECNHDLWQFSLLENDYYTINHSVINDNYFTATSNQVILFSKDATKSLFKLIKKDNGSYYLQVYNENDNNENIIHKYVRRKDKILIIDELIDGDPSFEFYLENEKAEFIESSAEYTDDGKFIKNVSDLNLNKVIYNINSLNGLLNSITNPKTIATNYIYDNKKRLIKINQNNKEINYTYNFNGLISKIKDDDKEYNIIYDEFLNIKEIKLGDTVSLITIIYEANNGYLKTINYGNSNIINYEYDNFGRVKTITKMNAVYNFYYDNYGNLSKISSNNDNYKYLYDSAQKLKEYQYNNFKIQYNYDACDNVVSKKYILDNAINNVNNLLNIEDAISKTKFEDNSINYHYDELGRLVNRNLNNRYNTSYTYLSNGNRTSLLVDGINNNNDTYKYKYDKLNNITHIYHNDILENEYLYDEYNQLIEEKNYLNNEIIIYTYDKFGNILSRRKIDLINYNLLLEDKYEYDNFNCRDQLAKYNDIDIMYDNIGNPLTIGNDVLTWINGKQLNSYNDIIYKYNMSGIRTSKIINNKETKYYLEGTSVVFEKRDNDVIYYLRNDTDDLIGFKYNNDVYYYVKNLQRDIIGILDSNCNLIVNYRYDSWGNILSITDSNGNDITDNNHIGVINPFRYRSYYYDTETNLYYLNSRYYSPMLKRFLNADSIIGANGDIMSYNLYSYCNNSPISNLDIDGRSIAHYLTIQRCFIDIVKRTCKKATTQKLEYFNMPENPEDRVCPPTVTTSKTKKSKKDNRKDKIKEELDLHSKITYQVGLNGKIGAGVFGIKSSFGLGLNQEYELYDEKMKCYNVVTVSAVFIIGSERRRKTQINCTTGESLGYDEIIEQEWYFGPVRYQEDKGIYFDFGTGVETFFANISLGFEKIFW